MKQSYTYNRKNTGERSILYQGAIETYMLRTIDRHVDRAVPARCLRGWKRTCRVYKYQKVVNQASTLLNYTCFLLLTWQMSCRNMWQKQKMCTKRWLLCNWKLAKYQTLNFVIIMLRPVFGLLSRPCRLSHATNVRTTGKTYLLYKNYFLAFTSAKKVTIIF